ncbi:MAG: HD domain-containing protein [Hespellia sp.]|jgi:predicted HD superfamily hydrolase involved in NAD metabolism|nr:HD domain-containing protein [Hespellia sp.]
MENQKIQEKLRKLLKKERYEHTIGVMYTAASLAMSHHAEIPLALKAGLLHDCGKYGTLKEQVERCKKHRIPLSDAELQMPSLVHAKLGVYYAQKRYETNDPEILGAIRYHTTGRPDMTLLEKIIYIADYIEPGRREIPGLTEIRQMAFRDLDCTVCMVSERTLEYLKAVGKEIDPLTVETCRYYNQR